MIEYQTVFEAAPWGWRATAGFAFQVVFVLFGLILGYALLRRKFPGMSRSVRCFCLVMNVFWLSIFIRVLVGGIIFATELEGAIQSNFLFAAEGVVEIVEQTPRRDTVRIEGQTFIVASGIFGIGYRDNAAHGGVLTEGARVRIRHLNGAILRVEMAVLP